MNNVNLIGRLVRNPEVNKLNNGNSVVRFTLAVDKQLSKEKKQEMESKNQPTADFINCVAFGGLADTIGRFAQKGKRIGISGRLQSGSYKAKDGSMRYTTDVVIENMTIIDWAESGGGFNDSGNGFNDFDDFNDFNDFDDRIPF